MPRIFPNTVVSLHWSPFAINLSLSLARVRFCCPLCCWRGLGPVPCYASLIDFPLLNSKHILCSFLEVLSHWPALWSAPSSSWRPRSSRVCSCSTRRTSWRRWGWAASWWRRRGGRRIHQSPDQVAVWLDFDDFSKGASLTICHVISPQFSLKQTKFGRWNNQIDFQPNLVSNPKCYPVHMSHMAYALPCPEVWPGSDRNPPSSASWARTRTSPQTTRFPRRVLKFKR